jgi:hypothetical protein
MPRIPSAERAIMGARTNFWLHVHELNLCLDEEGDTSRERRENIVQSLDDMPPLARRELIRELRYVLSELTYVAQVKLADFGSVVEET